MQNHKLISILSQHVTTLMQITNKTHGYLYKNNMILTKCLNTSVLLVCIALGCNNLPKIKYCDVDPTRNRHLSKSNTNKELHLNLIKDLKSTTCELSYFYYIMLTDATLYNAEGNSIYFPGHVFIIDKLCSNRNVSYNVYQSYINEYTLNEYLRFRNKSSKNILDSIINLYRYLSNEKVWDRDVTNIWKSLSTVDANKFEGYSTKGIFLRYKKFKSDKMNKHINGFIDKTNRSINRLIRKNQTDYFNMDISNTSNVKDIFTLKSDLNTLKNKINVYKNA